MSQERIGIIFLSLSISSLRGMSVLIYGSVTLPPVDTYMDKCVL